MMNYRNQSIVNFDTCRMFQMVQIGPCEVQVIDPYKISRNMKTMNIEIKEEKKLYQVVYSKRVRDKDFDAVPYGY